MPTGTVKWFNPEKGCGFIQPDLAGGRDVFVQIGAVQQSGLEGLSEGQKIHYELVEQERNGPTLAAKLRAV